MYGSSKCKAIFVRLRLKTVRHSEPMLLSMAELAASLRQPSDSAQAAPADIPFKAAVENTRRRYCDALDCQASPLG